ncbi:hypothetical protein EJB05_41441 [Eragrostis curvula]|uniref:Piwi domain-containing protein n=1 Tax=Eragrostis curvula TaxID=38414 RepID=A0A5J9T9L7_9POAL|nr:hypothetical protein EJB05_41441 [Eragrostis curvula]
MLEVLDMAPPPPPPPSRHPKGGHGHGGRKQPLQSSVAQPKAETAAAAVVPPEGGKRCGGGGGGGRRRGGRGRARPAVEPRPAPAPPVRTVIGPPVPSKGLTFCRRPGFGTVGTRCVVKANHFLAELPDKDLTQYDVKITPEVSSRTVNRAIIAELVRLYRESDLGMRLPAYDGRKNLYTAGTLPFDAREFVVRLTDDDDRTGVPPREREYRVAIKFAARADLHHLREFIAGRQADAPQEALQVLDIVLRELGNQRYVAIGRSFYSPDIRRPQRLGDGLQSWCGFYQSIRPTQMGLSLNIDMSSTAFIEPLPVIEFVAQILGKDVMSRPLSDSNRVKIKKALRGVKVEVTHRGNVRRKYRISGVTAQPTHELIFPIDDQMNMKSVVEYFKEMYGFTIQHPHLPCLMVGNQKKANYLPMEACKIVEGQRYTKRLNEKQITSLLKVTCQRPREQEMDILQTVHQNGYEQDPYAKEFGINISEKLTSVEARVLPAPWKVINGCKVNHWACINFSRSVPEATARGFCQELAQMCQISGMEFNSEPVMPIYSARPDQVMKALKHVYNIALNKLKGKELELLLAILPDNNGPLYGDIKRICETDLGLITQCCLTKHVFKISKQYLANVSLKINVKVVASQDWPEVTKYAGLVCAQAHRQELIQDLYKTWHDPQRGTVTGGMIRELLISFRKATGQKPLRIIFYSTFYIESRKYGSNIHLFIKELALLSDALIFFGTSRPAHYHVLWDENNFTADEMQTLTNNLCYTYARCTRSVSVVPPAYYAHLAAFRARFYMEPELSENHTSKSSNGTNGTSVKPLPAVKEKVKRVMFYC